MTYLMETTLPTIIGMGVVSHTTDTMFGKGSRGGKTSGKIKQSRVTVRVIQVAKTKVEATIYAVKFRNSLKRQGKPYLGRVQVKKVPGGYVAIYLRGR